MRGVAKERQVSTSLPAAHLRVEHATPLATILMATSLLSLRGLTCTPFLPCRVPFTSFLPHCASESDDSNSSIDSSPQGSNSVSWQAYVDWTTHPCDCHTSCQINTFLSDDLQENLRHQRPILLPIDGEREDGDEIGRGEGRRDSYQR